GGLRGRKSQEARARRSSRSGVSFRRPADSRLAAGPAVPDRGLLVHACPDSLLRRWLVLLAPPCPVLVRLLALRCDPERPCGGCADEGRRPPARAPRLGPLGPARRGGERLSPDRRRGRVLVARSSRARPRREGRALSAAGVRRSRGVGAAARLPRAVASGGGARRKARRRAAGRRAARRADPSG